MIECIDNNVYRKRRNKPKKVFRVVFVLAVLAAIYLYYNSIVEKTLVGICSDYLKSYSAQAVNEAVLKVIKDNPYKEYVYTEKNDNGDIILISTDSLKVNETNRIIALKTQEIMEEKFKKGIEIPALAFTGIKFLAGYGFNVNLKFITVSSVECDFGDEFLSAGINQTLHTLFLTVKTVATLNIPSNRKTEECFTKVLLGEAVIVGKVPQIYLNKV